MSSNAPGTRTTARTTQKFPIAAVPGPLMGSVTQRFFREGDDHEATSWEHARLPPDDVAAVDREADFDSFDRIPRARNPALTITVLGAGVLVAGAVWWMASGTRRAAWTAQLWTPATAALTRVRSEARALVKRPTEVPASLAPVATSPAPHVVEPVAAPSSSSNPTEPTATTTTTAETETETETAPAALATRASALRKVTRSAPVRRDVSTIYLMPTSPVEQPAPTGLSPASARGAAGENRPQGIEPRREPASSELSANQPRDQAPLHGFVWSPTARKLVPATTAPATDPSPTGGEARDNEAATAPPPASRPADDTTRGPDDPVPPTTPSE
jgi:hypothetical protein